MFIYVSPKFLTIFDDKQTPLQFAINEPQLIYAARCDMGNVNRYLSYHIQEIIDIVLSDEKDSGVLINLLTCQIEPLFQALLNNSNFCDKATEILSDSSNPSEIVISRLASITLSALIVLPDQSSKQFGFIYHLLKRCDNSSAFNLFYSILSDDERCLPAKQWLHSFGYPEYLMREIDNINYNYELPKDENPFFDRNYCVAEALYKLAAKSIQCEIFKNDFLNTNTVIIMKKTFSHPYPVFVKNARWDAINSLICEQNAEEMSSLLPEAILMLTEDLQHVYEYRVFSIQFITSILKYQPFFATYIIDEKIPNWILNLFLQFPNATIFHSAIREFVEIALNIDCISKIIVSTYTPILIDEGISQNNKVFFPTVIALIESIRKAGNENRNIKDELDKIPQFTQFCQNQFRDYKVKAEKPYGYSSHSSISNLLKSLI